MYIKPYFSISFNTFTNLYFPLLLLFLGKISALVLVSPDTTKFHIPFGGEHPFCKKFRNKLSKNYGGGTKYVFLLPVSELIKKLPVPGKHVISKSNGIIVPYSNYNPASDSLSRYKSFAKYSELAIWNSYLPNRQDTISLIQKLKDMPQYHHLSIACIGYDSLSEKNPDVQFGLTGGIEYNESSIYAASREVWEELGLSSGNESSSSKYPIDKLVLSVCNSFLFVF